MVTERKTYNQDRLSKVLQAVEKAQKLQDDRIKFGLDHVNLYVEDVEGDWLETWDDDEESLLLETNTCQIDKNGKTIVRLGQWFQQIIESGWHSVEEVLGTKEPDLALFSLRIVEARRAKFIDLGMQLAGHPVALIVTIREEDEQNFSILLQVQPIDDTTHLPESLKLMLLSPSGEVLHQEQARNASAILEVELGGKSGESFRVQVALDDVSVTEDFVI
ncbi:DUF1822 family protein [Phormidium nigroviride]